MIRIAVQTYAGCGIVDFRAGDYARVLLYKANPQTQSRSVVLRADELSIDELEYQWARNRVSVIIKQEITDEVIKKCSIILQGVKVPRTVGTVVEVDEKPAHGTAVVVHFDDGTQAVINPQLLVPT